MRNNLVIFSVTDFCNAKCKTCSFWKTKNPVFPPKERINQIVHDLKYKLNCSVVSITGGEPLTYPYLVDLVRAFNKAGILVQICTNGSLLNENKIKELSKAGLKMIYFSIDHFDEEKVYKNREIPNLLFKIKENIKILKKTPILIEGGITISRNNINDLEEIFRFALSIGIDEINVCLPVKETGSTFKLGNNDYDLMNLSKSEMVDIIDRLINLRKMYKGKLIHEMKFLEEMRSYYSNKTQKFSCKAGENIFYLDNRLNIYQCFFKNKKLGSIGEKIDVLKDVNCFECPLQCFREPSVYYHNLKISKLIMDYFKKPRYLRIVIYMIYWLFRDFFSSKFLRTKN
jgi:MoaA/NifB/PqqE/SkfB family radical SAM enzyme